MPSAWIDAGHRWLGWGPFPDGPVAEYLARSVSALSAFYGGLLLVLSADVRRYAPLIRYQSAAIMLLSASGVVVGNWAAIPLWFVGGDAIACWTYCIAMLLLLQRVEHSRSEPLAAKGPFKVEQGFDEQGPHCIASFLRRGENLVGIGQPDFLHSFHELHELVQVRKHRSRLVRRPRQPNPH